METNREEGQVEKLDSHWRRHLRKLQEEDAAATDKLQQRGEALNAENQSLKAELLAQAPSILLLKKVQLLSVPISPWRNLSLFESLSMRDRHMYKRVCGTFALVLVCVHVECQTQAQTMRIELRGICHVALCRRRRVRSSWRCAFQKPPSPLRVPRKQGRPEASAWAWRCKPSSSFL